MSNQGLGIWEPITHGCACERYTSISLLDIILLAGNFRVAYQPNELVHGTVLPLAAPV